ncbi:hypothetical protein [Streptomyces fungicidicus]|uniref:hypothetical protein n=1 Tax=Streptomyces fungicidicus TaxID=68203 RepID=UPI0038064090
MDERKDPAPAAGRRPTVAVAGRLSPVQEAWQRYVHHSLHQCVVCRSADGSPCDTAEGLYRAYQETAADAADQLAGRASPQGQ